VIWLWSTLLEMHTAKRRRERLAKAAEQLAELDKRLCGPRTRLRSLYKINERINEILQNNRVVRYLDVEPWQAEQEHYRQEHRGRAGPKTRYKREVKMHWRIRWEVDEEVIAYDQKSDGMYPILTNDRSRSLAQVLEVHKPQPVIEKRFEQFKSIHEIAPVMLKNEDRIKALFFVYFLVMMVQALIERELRGAMQRSEVEELALYPEQRTSKRPTCTQVMRLFGLTAGQLLTRDGVVVQVFKPELTELQVQTLELLGVPKADFWQ